MERIFLIHGWGGSPKKDWFPWAAAELNNRGYQVSVPEMPEPGNPKIDAWVNKIKEVIGTPRADDILIGHSIGTLAILRYLGTLTDKEHIQKALLIAPWHFITLGDPETERSVSEWVERPIDYEKIRTKADKIVAVLSENDPWVPLKENETYFREQLKPEMIVMQGMGHFSSHEEGYKIPFLLNLV